MFVSAAAGLFASQTCLAACVTRPDQEAVDAGAAACPMTVVALAALLLST